MRIAAHVFITDVHATGKTNLPVDNHGFSVVAEIQMKAVLWAGPCVWIDQIDAGFLQIPAKCGRQAMTADRIRHEPDGNAAVAGIDQGVFQLSPMVVIANDIELHQDIIARFANSGEHGLGDCGPIHQQIKPIAVADGVACQTFKRGLVQGQCIAVLGMAV